MIDDFEIGRTFDPAWFPGAPPSPSPATDGGLSSDSGVPKEGGGTATPSAPNEEGDASSSPSSSGADARDGGGCATAPSAPEDAPLAVIVLCAAVATLRIRRTKGRR